MPTLNDLQSKYGGQGLVVLGVHSDPDTAEGVKAVSELKATYAMAFDGGKLMDTLGFNSFPTYLVLDRNGKVRFEDVFEENLEPSVKKLLAER